MTVVVVFHIILYCFNALKDFELYEHQFKLELAGKSINKRD